MLLLTIRATIYLVQEYDGRRENQEKSCYVIRSSLAGRQDEIETQEALDNGADTDKLNKLKIVLINKFQTFHDLVNGEKTTVESKWKGIKEAITSTCHEVLGHKKHHHKEWITVDTLDKIQERSNKKAAINTSRTRAAKAKA
ncbi:unnamed protein product [Schistosoma margrebowiei]|uniref:Uncharacterized protein n=1 Tax=Schistosoma margrebowiei TaxID=48269 RepID=A0A183NC21_9TREM|nr:unnamed protein product [Schistosoma margrebowiei]